MTKFTLVATDIYGNSDTKVISVECKAVEASTAFKQWNVSQVKRQQSGDAVAITIGIEKFK